MTTISLPASLSGLHGANFQGCTGLTSVYYAAEEPAVSGVTVFPDEVYTSATLYVPEEAVEKCKQIDPWKNFNSILSYDFSGIEETVVDINNEDPFEVFSVDGIRVSSNSLDGLVPGIYVVRQGNAIKKVIVK